MNRHTQRDREAQDAAARRQRAAAILGRVRSLLTDLDPARIGINVNPATTPDQLQALEARVKMLRDELLVFAAADEDERVATATAKLEVAIYNTFHFVSWHARDLLTHRDAALDMFKHAEHEHLKAMTLERLVLDLLRGRDVAELEAELRTLGEQDSNGAISSAGAMSPSSRRSFERLGSRTATGQQNPPKPRLGAGAGSAANVLRRSARSGPFSIRS